MEVKMKIKTVNNEVVEVHGDFEIGAKYFVYTTESGIPFRIEITEKEFNRIKKKDK